LRIMPPEKVADILGGTKEADSTAVWEKLATLPPANLVGYLRNESPQTIAVILGRLPPEQAARVMSVLPDELTTDVALRMVRMDRIHQSVLTDIEETLHRELVGNATASDGPDSESVLAELLNRSDRDMVARLLASLEETEPDAAARVRRLMFTFDDLARIDPATFGVLIGETPVDKLAIALHSAVPAIRDLFLSTMSERAANMLRDEIESMAAPRRKAVEETQNDIVVLAKRLIEEGRIFLLDQTEETGE
jgi:flagellar motor switch protein FliG